MKELISYIKNELYKQFFIELYNHLQFYIFSIFLFFILDFIKFEI